MRAQGQLRKSFLKLDKRGDGRIDADELHVGLAVHYDILISMGQARALCTKYDCNRASWTMDMTRGSPAATHGHGGGTLRPRFDYSTFCDMCAKHPYTAVGLCAPRHTAKYDHTECRSPLHATVWDPAAPSLPAESATPRLP